MRVLIMSVLLLYAAQVYAQQRIVSITIDDVPNVHLYKENGNVSVLQRRLDSLNIPVAIFINEGNLRLAGDFETNKNLLKSWLMKRYVTPGNHSYSHPNYGETGEKAFQEEVLKGEELTNAMLATTGTSVRYFRFPFNALGRDSAAHVAMSQFLAAHHYISTPFTVESEDWMYTQLYEDALTKGDQVSARQTGESYVDRTMRTFAYFDSLSISLFGRPVRQIYLCHDNRLNTDFLPVLIGKLKEKKYKMISLDEAMADPLYQSTDYYFGNAGFSWMYRWVSDPAKRKAMQRAEPEDMETQRAFEEFSRRR